MIIRHCQAPSSKYPQCVSLAERSCSVVVIWSCLLCATCRCLCHLSIDDGSMYVQCECVAGSCSTIAQFVFGWACFNLWHPDRTLSSLFLPQDIATWCSENRVVAGTSSDIPPNRLQSFLYWHQYGELCIILSLFMLTTSLDFHLTTKQSPRSCFKLYNYLAINTILILIVILSNYPLRCWDIIRTLTFTDTLFIPCVSRVWSLMEQVTVWRLIRSFTVFKRTAFVLLTSPQSTFLHSCNSYSWWV